MTITLCVPWLLNSCPFLPSEGCEVGQWSEWGSCTRRNKTCGFKWGLETRTRHIVKKPPKDTIPCPTIAESRRCKMPMRHCRRGEIRSVCVCVCTVNAVNTNCHGAEQNPTLYSSRLHAEELYFIFPRSQRPVKGLEKSMHATLTC